ncbi:MAG: tetratricopeptide repeat protein [Gammaproteobacteria bacterium]|nr:tetratricopeptide repeat protein [Gammaproteobacteria bacterium]
MSVINQMLRDLEQRKAKDSISNHYIDEVNIVAKKQFNLWWFTVPVLIALALMIYLYSPLLFKEGTNENTLIKNLYPLDEKHTTKTQEVVFPDLPKELSEIETVAAPMIDAIQTEEIKKSVQQQKEKLQADKNIVAIEKVNAKKVYKQPSVKIETYEKAEQKLEKKESAKKMEVVKVKTKNIESIKLEKKPLVKVKASNVKVKAPIKSTQKKSSEDIVYQAGQLMVSNQSAAIQLLEENIKRVSPDADYYSLLANLQQRRKKYDNAIISYRKALELEPNKGELWIGIALAYRGTGEENNALKAFKQALNSIDISSELKQYAAQQLDNQ